MKKLTNKFIGTFPLVLFSCGAAVIVGIGGGATSIEVLEISCAFGHALVRMTDGSGPVSRCNANPAVSLCVLTAGRIHLGEFIGYTIAKILSALVAAIMYLILESKASGRTNGLSQNGWARGISTNQYVLGRDVRCRRKVTLPSLYSGRHAKRRAGTSDWCRHQDNSGLYSYRLHQRDRFVSGPHAVNRSDTRRHRRKRRSVIAGLAAHRRAHARPRAPRA